MTTYLFPLDFFGCYWTARPGELFLRGRDPDGNIAVLDPNDSVDGTYKVLTVLEGENC